jgi:dihydrofolate reductase
MARLIMWNLMTLDGYFEGPDSDLSFMQYAWGPELESFINEQAKDYGVIVFGRKTYEGMASY